MNNAQIVQAAKTVLNIPGAYIVVPGDYTVTAQELGLYVEAKDAFYAKMQGVSLAHYKAHAAWVKARCPCRAKTTTGKPCKNWVGSACSRIGIYADLFEVGVTDRCATHKALARKALARKKQG